MTPSPRPTGPAHPAPASSREDPGSPEASAPIRVHIGRLVLDRSFAHLPKDALRAAVETELARLLEEGGSLPLPAQARRGRVDAGRAVLEAGADARAVGRLLARHIHEGLGG